MNKNTITESLSAERDWRLYAGEQEGGQRRLTAAARPVVGDRRSPGRQSAGRLQLQRRRAVADADLGGVPETLRWRVRITGDVGDLVRSDGQTARGRAATEP